MVTNNTGGNDYVYMDVSEKSGTPKSSILIGFSIINHPFCGTRRASLEASMLAYILVGGFNPSEKCESNEVISPSRGENEKHL